MGNEREKVARKPRFLCIHGFRTSGEIFKKQIGKWPESILQKLDLVFVDGPFPCRGKSEVEGFFDPPYYEWYQYNKAFTKFRDLDKCISYVEDCMIKHGPIDGLLGFSQGAALAAGLPGMQAKGYALQKVPKIKFVIIIGGGRFGAPSVAKKAYSAPIECPSLHFIEEADYTKKFGIELLESFVDPTVIYHSKGHTIPRLDEKAAETMLGFLERIQKEVK